MELIQEPLPGVKILRPFVYEDDRGYFVKTFHEAQLKQHDIEINIKEEFYTTSASGVVRGMHFQIPPHAHQKFITCVSGKVLDVVLDLRKESPTYGQHASFELSEENHYIAYIPIGFAHGFLSQKPNSALLYKTDCVYTPESDQGILWNSFGHKWEINDLNVIISDRDRQHVALENFISPF